MAAPHNPRRLPIRSYVELLARFEPRNPAVAKTVVFVLTWAAGLVTTVVTLAFPQQEAHGYAGFTVVGCLVVLAVAAVIKLAPRPPRVLWAVQPIAAVLLITVLDVVTRDASPFAQIFFFPVLYAGAQLRRQAAAIVCAAAIAGEAMVNVLLMPATTAMVNVCFAAAALATAAALLVHSADRTDQLIAQLER
jgi:hypothetical protein